MMDTKKVLLTGMTAAQASVYTNAARAGFAFQITQALSFAERLSDVKYDIDWAYPEVSWDMDYLSQYDSVIVGLSPITSLGANRAYGALSVIDYLWDDDRLRLFIDGANPKQVMHSLRSVLRNPESLFKDFYSKRYDYDLAQEGDNPRRLMYTIGQLVLAPWPETFYPKLPWEQEDPRDSLLPFAAMNVTDINLDIFTLNERGLPSMPVVEKWVVDDDRSRWRDEVANTLEYPVIPMKERRFSSDSDVDVTIATSLGVLLSPGKQGRTWWTRRYAQALRLHTPVVTEWRDAQDLGDSWTVLASQIEHMSDDRRLLLAAEQLEAYKRAIGDEVLAARSLEQYLGLKEGISWPRTP